MRSNIRLALAWLSAIGVATAAACTFPTIGFQGDTGGSGGGQHASTGAAPTTSTGSTGASPSTSTSSSSSSSSSSTSVSSSSSSGGDGGCTTDDDGDHVVSWVCDETDPTKDCADEDPRAYPDAGFAPTAIMGTVKSGTNIWDFNCDGTVTQETQAGCSGVCGSSTQVFKSAVACGMTGTLGTCNLLCGWTALSPTQTRVQRCK